MGNMAMANMALGSVPAASMMMPAMGSGPMPDMNMLLAMAMQQNAMQHGPKDNMVNMQGLGGYTPGAMKALQSWKGWYPHEPKHVETYKEAKKRW